MTTPTDDPRPAAAPADPAAAFADMAQWFTGPADSQLAGAWQRYLNALAANPALFGDVARRHAAAQGELLASFTGGQADGAGDAASPPPRRDPRFAHEAWTANPFYRYLRDSYELNSQLMREAAAAVDLDERDRQAVDYLLNQVISALAPSNFAATNPEVVAATVDSQGDNLRRGLRNYLDDAQAGRVTNTDLGAFRVGANLATTPGKVIAQNHVMQLIEYAPATAKVNARPLLVVPPCINKYYILDLAPANSFIQALVASGQRVFLVSWANAGPAQAGLTWDDYVAGGVLEALAITHEAAGGRHPVNTLGYCIGGTLLACALAVQRAAGDFPVATMSLMTAMLDHCATGDLGLFVDEATVADTERRYAAGGLLDGKVLARSFASLRPAELVWPYVVSNYLLGKTPPAWDILYWNADSTNLPGRMYAWHLRHNYLANDVKDGTVAVCGTPVDYGAIGLPGMVIATERDHIVPWPAAYASARLLGKDVDFVLASSGHIAGVVNPPASGKGHHFAAAKAARLPADGAAWQAKAKRVAGSWWPRYFTWLDRHGGGKAAAPKRPGTLRHRPLEDAPGSYVTAPLPDAAAATVPEGTA